MKCLTKQTEKKFFQTYLNGLPHIYKIAIFLLIFSFQSKIYSQVNISGYATSYAGDILKIYKYSDYIVHKSILADTAKVHKNGYFKFSIDVDNTQKVFIDLSHVNTYLYVEPDSNYKIRIPTKQILTHFQLADPYFVKENASAYVISNYKYEINRLIQIFNVFISKNTSYLLNVYSQVEILKEIDTLKIVADTFAIDANNEYFTKYKEYSIAIMRYVTLKDDIEFYIDSFFVNKPVLYYLTPYTDLFDYIFEDFFSGTNSLIEMPNVYKGMYLNNFLYIKNALINDTITGFNDDLAQLITVKSLYDKFFRVERAQNDIIFTLQSVQQTDVNSYIYDAVHNVFEAITKTRKYFPAYNFNLLNKRGKEKKLEDFSGKFVYLNFIYVSSGRGLLHLPVLQSYNDNNIKNLEIVTVFVGDTITEMIDFLDEHKEYKWTFLFAKLDNQTLTNYNVKVFPSYYLIDPERNMCLDNTPTPEEEFEQTYNSVYKQWQSRPINNTGIR
ncbi:MAG: redoxin domain-containing protein [Bacteroidales bacterium]|nr:redoxin domain-containing protein [Bacteroidales bacterium]